MKHFRKHSTLIIAFCVLCSCFKLTGCEQTTSSDVLYRHKVEIHDEYEDATSQRSEPRSEENLLGTLWSPLRASIESAKLLFGGGSVQSGIDSAYQMFLRAYNKSYPPEELVRRAKLYLTRRKWFEESARIYREGKSSFLMRENAFADWDEQELKKLTGVSPPTSEEDFLPEERAEPIMVSYSFENNSLDALNETAEVDEHDGHLIVRAQIPASKDWRESGCVSTPINQMKCGACYAIATMSVIETMRCMNRASSPTLSPQQIVDCATPRAGYQNYGCNGGWPTRVLKYLQDVGTATRDSCYPFVRRQDACKLRQVQARQGCTLRASPTDRNRIQYQVLNNERDILYHVANTGPVVTVMKASSKFLYYSRGIFDDSSCSRRRDDVDHAIVIVGYGRENGADYWLIKNSWGTTSWGLAGYGKYKRGSNACSIGHWGWVTTSEEEFKGTGARNGSADSGQSSSPGSSSGSSSKAESIADSLEEHQQEVGSTNEQSLVAQKNSNGASVVANEAESDSEPTNKLAKTTTPEVFNDQHSVAPQNIKQPLKSALVNNNNNNNETANNNLSKQEEQRAKQQSPIQKSITNNLANNSGLNLNMTASEMRELLSRRKKFDPKKSQMNIRQKYEIIQQM